MSQTAVGVILKLEKLPGDASDFHRQKVATIVLKTLSGDTVQVVVDEYDFSVGDNCLYVRPGTLLSSHVKEFKFLSQHGHVRRGQCYVRKVKIHGFESNGIAVKLPHYLSLLTAFIDRANTRLKACAAMRGVEFVNPLNLDDLVIAFPLSYPPAPVITRNPWHGPLPDIVKRDAMTRHDAVGVRMTVFLTPNGDDVRVCSRNVEILEKDPAKNKFRAAAVASNLHKALLAVADDKHLEYDHYILYGTLTREKFWVHRITSKDGAKYNDFVLRALADHGAVFYEKQFDGTL